MEIRSFVDALSLWGDLTRCRRSSLASLPHEEGEQPMLDHGKENSASGPVPHTSLFGHRSASTCALFCPATTTTAAVATTSKAISELALEAFGCEDFSNASHSASEAEVPCCDDRRLNHPNENPFSVSLLTKSASAVKRSSALIDELAPSLIAAPSLSRSAAPSPITGGNHSTSSSLSLSRSLDDGSGCATVATKASLCMAEEPPASTMGTMAVAAAGGRGGDDDVGDEKNGEDSPFLGNDSNNNINSGTTSSLCAMESLDQPLEEGNSVEHHKADDDDDDDNFCLFQSGDRESGTFIYTNDNELVFDVAATTQPTCDGPCASAIKPWLEDDGGITTPVDQHPKASPAAEGESIAHDDTDAAQEGRSGSKEKLHHLLHEDEQEQEEEDEEFEVDFEVEQGDSDNECHHQHHQQQQPQQQQECHGDGEEPVDSDRTRKALEDQLGIPPSAPPSERAAQRLNRYKAILSLPLLLQYLNPKPIESTKCGTEKKRISSGSSCSSSSHDDNNNNNKDKDNNTTTTNNNNRNNCMHNNAPHQKNHKNRVHEEAGMLTFSPSGVPSCRVSSVVSFSSLRHHQRGGDANSRSDDSEDEDEDEDEDEEGRLYRRMVSLRSSRSVQAETYQEVFRYLAANFQELDEGVHFSSALALLGLVRSLPMEWRPVSSPSPLLPLPLPPSYSVEKKNKESSGQNAAESQEHKDDEEKQDEKTEETSTLSFLSSALRSLLHTSCVSTPTVPLCQFMAGVFLPVLSFGVDVEHVVDAVPWDLKYLAQVHPSGVPAAGAGTASQSDGRSSGRPTCGGDDIEAMRAFYPSLLRRRSRVLLRDAFRRSAAGHVTSPTSPFLRLGGEAQDDDHEVDDNATGVALFIRDYENVVLRFYQKFPAVVLFPLRLSAWWGDNNNNDNDNNINDTRSSIEQVESAASAAALWGDAMADSSDEDEDSEAGRESDPADGLAAAIAVAAPPPWRQSRFTATRTNNGKGEENQSTTTMPFDAAKEDRGPTASSVSPPPPPPPPPLLSSAMDEASPASGPCPPLSTLSLSPLSRKVSITAGAGAGAPGGVSRSHSAARTPLISLGLSFALDYNAKSWKSTSSTGGAVGSHHSRQGSGIWSPATFGEPSSSTSRTASPAYFPTSSPSSTTLSPCFPSFPATAEDGGDARGAGTRVPSPVSSFARNLEVSRQQGSGGGGNGGFTWSGAALAALHRQRLFASLTTWFQSPSYARHACERVAAPTTRSNHTGGGEGVAESALPDTSFSVLSVSTLLPLLHTAPMLFYVLELMQMQMAIQQGQGTRFHSTDSTSSSTPSTTNPGGWGFIRDVLLPTLLHLEHTTDGAGEVHHRKKSGGDLLARGHSTGIHKTAGITASVAPLSTPPYTNTTSASSFGSTSPHRQESPPSSLPLPVSSTSSSSANTVVIAVEFIANLMEASAWFRRHSSAFATSDSPSSSSFCCLSTPPPAPHDKGKESQVKQQTGESGCDGITSRSGSGQKGEKQSSTIPEEAQRLLQWQWLSGDSAYHECLEEDASRVCRLQQPWRSCGDSLEHHDKDEGIRGGAHRRNGMIGKQGGGSQRLESVHRVWSRVQAAFVLAATPPSTCPSSVPPFPVSPALIATVVQAAESAGLLARTSSTSRSAASSSPFRSHPQKLEAFLKQALPIPSTTASAMPSSSSTLGMEGVPVDDFPRCVGDVLALVVGWWRVQLEEVQESLQQRLLDARLVRWRRVNPAAGTAAQLPKAAAASMTRSPPRPSRRTSSLPGSFTWSLWGGGSCDAATAAPPTPPPRSTPLSEGATRHHDAKDDMIPETDELTMVLDWGPGPHLLQPGATAVLRDSTTPERSGHHPQHPSVRGTQTPLYTQTPVMRSRTSLCSSSSSVGTFPGAAAGMADSSSDHYDPDPEDDDHDTDDNALDMDEAEEEMMDSAGRTLLAGTIGRNGVAMGRALPHPLDTGGGRPGAWGAEKPSPSNVAAARAARLLLRSATIVPPPQPTCRAAVPPFGGLQSGGITSGSVSGAPSLASTPSFALGVAAGARATTSMTMVNRSGLYLNPFIQQALIRTLPHWLLGWQQHLARDSTRHAHNASTSGVGGHGRQPHWMTLLSGSTTSVPRSHYFTSSRFASPFLTWVQSARHRVRLAVHLYSTVFVSATKNRLAQDVGAMETALCSYRRFIGELSYELVQRVRVLARWLQFNPGEQTRRTAETQRLAGGENHDNEEAWRAHDEREEELTERELEAVRGLMTLMIDSTAGFVRCAAQPVSATAPLLPTAASCLPQPKDFLASASSSSLLAPLPHGSTSAFSTTVSPPHTNVPSTYQPFFRVRWLLAEYTASYWHCILWALLELYKSIVATLQKAKTRRDSSKNEESSRTMVGEKEEDKDNLAAARRPLEKKMIWLVPSVVTHLCQVFQPFWDTRRKSNPPCDSNSNNDNNNDNNNANSNTFLSWSRTNSFSTLSAANRHQSSSFRKAMTKEEEEGGGGGDISSLPPVLSPPRYYDPFLMKSSGHLGESGGTQGRQSASGTNVERQRTCNLLPVPPLFAEWASKRNNGGQQWCKEVQQSRALVAAAAPSHVLLSYATEITNVSTIPCIATSSTSTRTMRSTRPHTQHQDPSPSSHPLLGAQHPVEQSQQEQQYPHGWSEETVAAMHHMWISVAQFQNCVVQVFSDRVCSATATAAAAAAIPTARPVWPSAVLSGGGGPSSAEEEDDQQQHSQDGDGSVELGRAATATTKGASDFTFQDDLEEAGLETGEAEQDGERDVVAQQLLLLMNSLGAVHHHLQKVYLASPSATQPQPRATERGDSTIHAGSSHSHYNSSSPHSSNRVGHNAAIASATTNNSAIPPVRRRVSGVDGPPPITAHRTALEQSSATWAEVCATLQPLYATCHRLWNKLLEAAVGHFSKSHAPSLQYLSIGDSGEGDEGGQGGGIWCGALSAEASEEAAKHWRRHIDHVLSQPIPIRAAAVVTRGGAAITGRKDGHPPLERSSTANTSATATIGGGRSYSFFSPSFSASPATGAAAGAAAVKSSSVSSPSSSLVCRDEICSGMLQLIQPHAVRLAELWCGADQRHYRLRIEGVRLVCVLLSHGVYALGPEELLQCWLAARTRESAPEPLMDAEGTGRNPEDDAPLSASMNAAAATGTAASSPLLTPSSSSCAMLPSSSSSSPLRPATQLFLLLKETLFPLLIHALVQDRTKPVREAACDALTNVLLKRLAPIAMVPVYIISTATTTTPMDWTNPTGTIQFATTVVSTAVEMMTSQQNAAAAGGMPMRTALPQEQASPRPSSRRPSTHSQGGASIPESSNVKRTVRSLYDILVNAILWPLILQSLAAEAAASSCTKTTTATGTTGQSSTKSERTLSIAPAIRYTQRIAQLELAIHLGVDRRRILFPLLRVLAVDPVLNVRLKVAKIIEDALIRSHQYEDDHILWMPRQQYSMSVGAPVGGAEEPEPDRRVDHTLAASPLQQQNDDDDDDDVSAPNQAQTDRAHTQGDSFPHCFDNTENSTARNPAAAAEEELEQDRGKQAKMATTATTTPALGIMNQPHQRADEQEHAALPTNSPLITSLLHRIHQKEKKNTSNSDNTNTTTNNNVSNDETDKNKHEKTVLTLDTDETDHPPSESMEGVARHSTSHRDEGPVSNAFSFPPVFVPPLLPNGALCFTPHELQNKVIPILRHLLKDTVEDVRLHAAAALVLCY